MVVSPGEHMLSTDDRRSLAELYALLSACFQTPDEELVEAIEEGDLHEQLLTRAEPLGIDSERPSLGDIDSVGEFQEAYLRSFEGYEGPSAPPAESVYEPWWDAQDREILSGPAAADMRRRFDEVGADVPERYPPDHVALLLEYGSLLLETGELEAYDQFHRDHFDWIPEFHARVEETCDEPFYRWATAVLSATIDAVESRLRQEQ